MITHDMFSATRTICHDHVSCTSFRVGRVTAGVVDCTNCHRVDTIRVAIEIALVFMLSTIAACENVYRPFSLSSVVNAFWKSFPNKIFGSIHGLTVVCRSSAAAINANLVVTIGERSSLIIEVMRLPKIRIPAVFKSYALFFLAATWPAHLVPWWSGAPWAWRGRRSRKSSRYPRTILGVRKKKV